VISWLKPEPVSVSNEEQNEISLVDPESDSPPAKKPTEKKSFFDDVAELINSQRTPGNK
jgi:hypothetical protein